MKKTLFLYEPHTRKPRMFSTVDLGDSNYETVQSIIPLTVMQAVQITTLEGDIRMFYGMPFEIEEWT